MHGDAELTSVPFFADDIQTQFIQTSQSSSAYTPSSDYPERTLAFLDGSTVSTASLVVQATQPTSVTSPEEQNDSD